MGNNPSDLDNKNQVKELSNTVYDKSMEIKNLKTEIERLKQQTGNTPSSKVEQSWDPLTFVSYCYRREDIPSCISAVANYYSFTTKPNEFVFKPMVKSGLIYMESRLIVPGREHEYDGYYLVKSTVMNQVYRVTITDFYGKNKEMAIRSMTNYQRLNTNA